MLADRKSALYMMLSSLVWLVLMTNTLVIPVYSQFLFQFPAAGVSFWKGHLYVGWMALCGAYCLSPRAVTVRKGRLIFSLIAIMAAGLIVHLCLVFAIDVPAIHPMIFYANGSISSHSLLHSHVLKGVIAWWIEIVNLKLSMRADTGVPFLVYLPHWIFPVVGGLYVLLAAELLKLVRDFYLSRDRSIAGLIFISTLAFYILRTVIDGGLFCCEFLGALPIFIAVLIEGKKLQSITPGLIALFLIAFCVDFFYRNGSLPPPYSWFSKNSLMHCIFLLGLGAKFLLDCSRTRRLFIGVFSILFALYLNRGSYFDYDIRYLNTISRKGSETIVTSFFGQEYPGEVIILDGVIKVFRQRQTENVSNWAIHSINRVPPGYRIVAQNGLNCDFGAPYRVKGKIIEAKGIERLPSDCSGGIAPSMKIDWARLPHMNLGQFDGQIHGCVAGASNASMMARLGSCGLPSFIVVPEQTSIGQSD